MTVPQLRCYTELEVYMTKKHLFLPIIYLFISTCSFALNSSAAYPYDEEIKAYYQCVSGYNPQMWISEEQEDINYKLVLKNLQDPTKTILQKLNGFYKLSNAGRTS